MSRAQLTSTVEQNTGGAVAPFAAGKNKIINGDFGIWQRYSGSAITLSDGNYGPDRWRRSGNGSGTYTTNRVPFTVGFAPVAGYESAYYCQYQVTSPSGASYNTFQQPIEDVRTLAGQVSTYSIWLQTTSGTVSVTPQFHQYFGSGGSSDNVVNGPTWTVTTTWQRFTATFSAQSISGKTIGTGNWVSVDLGLPLNTAITLNLWGAQLEAGSVATPFTTATGTVQGELAACQRYFETLGAGSGPVTSSSHATIYGIYKVTKRASPSISIQSGTNGIAQIGRSLANITAIGVYAGNLNTCLFDATSSDTGMTTNQICVLQGEGVIAISSEL
jgi:hypothetical protein